MKKVILVAAAAGFLVGIITGCTWFYIYSHGFSQTGGARLFARISNYAWPTAFMMMDADKPDVGTILLFIASSIANACIYAIVAFCIYIVWRKLYRINSTQKD